MVLPFGIGQGYYVLLKQITDIWTERNGYQVADRSCVILTTTAFRTACKSICFNYTNCVAVEWTPATNSCAILSRSPEHDPAMVMSISAANHYARGYLILASSTDIVNYNPPYITPNSVFTAEWGPNMAQVDYTLGDVWLGFSGTNFAPTAAGFVVWLTQTTVNSSNPAQSSQLCPVDLANSTSTRIQCIFPPNLFGVFFPMVQAIDTFVWSSASFRVFRGALVISTVPDATHSFLCAGGEQLVIMGQGFSVQSLVTIDSVTAQVVNFSSNVINGTNWTYLVVTTPPGTGVQKPIIVREGGIPSQPLRTFNYAAPTINTITSANCTLSSSPSANGRVFNCNRYGGWITIKGANFAGSLLGPPTVSIGTGSCQSLTLSLQSQGADADTITCFFPIGSSDFQQITVSQFNGPSVFSRVDGTQLSLGYAPCAPGTRDNSTSGNPIPACVVCGPGTFQDLAAQTACKACAPGSYNNLTQQTQCTLCDYGTYQNLTNGVWCPSCDPGTAAGALGMPFCLPCTPGTFANGTHALTCAACGQGTYQPASGTSVCVACDPGSYGPQTQLTGCVLCQSGKYAAGVGNNNCTDCLPGFSQPSANSTSCTGCAPGTASGLPAQATCSNCEAGSYAADYNNTHCTSCELGKYQNMTVQSTCLFCDPGTFAADQGRVVCPACPAGTWFNDTGATFPCNKCGKGLYQPDAGATDCLQCGPGNYSSGTGAALCAECNPGSYNNQTGQAGCLTCPPGQSQDQPGQRSCNGCPPGSYSTQSGYLNCTACSPGSYAPYEGSTNCTLCPLGTAQNSSGQAQCDICPNGRVASVVGLLSCLDCDALISLAPDQPCAQCPPYSSSDASRTTCTCQTGYYSVSFAYVAANPTVEQLTQQANDANNSKTASWLLGYFCMPCPSGANCLLNGTSISTVQPMSGWSGDKEGLNVVFFACPNPDSCTPAGCQPGYTGSLCKSCAKGYGSIQGDQCTLCAERSWEVSRLGLIVVAVIVLLALFVYQTRKSALKDSVSFMIAAKILVSGMQFNAIALTMNFKFVETVGNVLNTQGTVSQLGLSSIFSSDCALESKSYNPVLVSSALFLFSPLLIFLCTLPLAALAACYSRRRHRQLLESMIELPDPDTQPGAQSFQFGTLFKDYAITATVIIIFIIHPMLTKKAFEMFNCVQIGVHPREVYLYADLSIQCYTYPHIIWVFLLGIPLLLVMVGEPLMFFSFLHKHRGDLTQDKYKLTYSFLYKGYQPHLWSVWEVSIMTRKVAIVGIAVFGRSSTRIQALLAVALCFIMGGFHMAYSPFQQKGLNRLEALSIITSATLYFFAQFLFAGVSDVDTDSQLFSQVMIALLQIAFIVAALVYIFYGVFHKVRVVVQKRRMTKDQRKILELEMGGGVKTFEADDEMTKEQPPKVVVASSPVLTPPPPDPQGRKPAGAPPPETEGRNMSPAAPEVRKPSAPPPVASSAPSTQYTSETATAPGYSVAPSGQQPSMYAQVNGQSMYTAVESPGVVPPQMYSAVPSYTSEQPETS